MVESWTKNMIKSILGKYKHKRGNNMISFKNDYSEGAHTNILNALMRTNLSQTTGYGLDQLSNEAKRKIKQKMNYENVDIHFVSGGTQANLIVLSSLLRPYEAVISANSGHINVHETGAIEATGHKVCIAKDKDGKLYPEAIEKVLAYHTDEHMVEPKVVYISNSTEIGTFYTKEELMGLREFCQANNLYLFLDGARLGSALEASGVTLEDIVNAVDVFYIGGTKNGALLGEAIVIKNDILKKNFRFNIKQKGALLAKGRVLGIQFLELFKGNLYFELAGHANQMAEKLYLGIDALGYEFLTKTGTNQVFPIFPTSVIEYLKQEFDFHIWEKRRQDESVIRLVTSWATTEKMVDDFMEYLKKYKKN